MVAASLCRIQSRICGGGDVALSRRKRANHFTSSSKVITAWQLWFPNMLDNVSGESSTEQVFPPRSFDARRHNAKRLMRWPSAFMSRASAPEYCFSYAAQLSY